MHLSRLKACIMNVWLLFISACNVFLRSPCTRFSFNVYIFICQFQSTNPIFVTLSELNQTLINYWMLLFYLNFLWYCSLPSLMALCRSNIPLFVLNRKKNLWIGSKAFNFVLSSLQDYIELQWNVIFEGGTILYSELSVPHTFLYLSHFLGGT